MKIAIIARSTFYSAPGGDTVQAVQTARALTDLGVQADIWLSDEKIDYSAYHLLHFFNITRPADILYHSKKSGKPYVVSTILCDYSEFDKNHRRSFGFLFRFLSSHKIEYLKTVARWVLRRDHLSSLSYLRKGQRRSILEILKNAELLLPNSTSEYQRIVATYPGSYNHIIAPNGADPELFQYDPSVPKDPKMVLCVARIEGIKNQLQLIKAVNGTDYQLVLIGRPAPNQPEYYQECRRIADDNVTFIDHIPQTELIDYYQRAKVHVLPSWFETTGLSSVEAALMGCNIVITDRGDAKEYFENDAFYCDPGNHLSIRHVIDVASKAYTNTGLRHKILDNYTWQHAAQQTLNAYQTVLYETESSNIGYPGDTQPLWGF